MDFKKFLTKKTYIWLIVILISFVIIRGSAGNKGPKYEFVQAKISNLTQIVSATGKVKPSQTIDLSFGTVERVARINFEVGQAVKRGQVIASLQNAKLVAQRDQAQAALDAQEAKLSELESGARPEDVKVSQTQLDKAKSDLNDLYQKSPSVLNQAFNVANDAFRRQIKEMFNYLEGAQIPYAISYSYCGTQASDGSYSEIQRSSIDTKLDSWQDEVGKISGSNVKSEDIDKNLDIAQNSLEFFQAYLNRLNQTLTIDCTLDASSTQKISGFRSSISTVITNINSSLGTIRDLHNSIHAQKLTVQSYQDQLDLKQAKTREEQIAYQKAQVASAQASLDLAKSQLADATLVSPIDGIVTVLDLKVGETVSTGKVVASVISVDPYQLESNINETDVAKIKIGNKADIIFEAFGSQKPFVGEVIKIDPAQTVVDNVVTYKTTLKINDFDSVIKPGMTADMDIITAQKENVLSVPQRAIIKKNGKSFASILENGKVTEIPVVVGIKGSSGDIEIISGLKEGQKIIVSQ